MSSSHTPDPPDSPWQRDEPDSPCVKICILDPKSKRCIGCKRTGDEIAKWGRLSASARTAIMADLATRPNPKRTPKRRQKPPPCASKISILDLVLVDYLLSIFKNPTAHHCAKLFCAQQPLKIDCGPQKHATSNAPQSTTHLKPMVFATTLLMGVRTRWSATQCTVILLECGVGAQQFRNLNRI